MSLFDREIGHLMVESNLAKRELQIEETF